MYAVSVFCLTILFFGPLYIYFTNTSEFPYLFSEVLYLFVAMLLLCIAVMLILLLPLKTIIHQKAVSLLFALAFLLWLQGNVIVLNYGLLDGREINWNNYIVYGVIDTALWLILLFVALIKSAFVYKLIKKVTIALVLIQVVSLSIAWFQAPEQPYWKKYDVNDKSKYTFSSKKNIIILVLDTFQTDIFQELVNEDPKYKETFQGFTYFRNAVGGFPSTYLSIPLILTGKYYDNSVPVPEYLKNSFTSSSIPFILKKNNYQVDLFTDKRLIYCNENIASNIIKSSGVSDKKEELIYTYKVTLFRYLPHYLKRYFYTMGNPIGGDLKSAGDSSGKDLKSAGDPSGKDLKSVGEPIDADLEFANKILSESNTSSKQYVFKFFHLWGTHPPFHLNERLEREDQKFDRSGYKIQAKAALEITSRFLSALKKIGVYDNSMIFVIGDHGAGASGSFGLNVGASGYTEDNKTSVKIKSAVTVTSGLPLILVKPFNSNKEMRISDAPVSQSDIPKTIFSELGLKGRFPGESMFSIRETDFRERRFLEYTWKNEYMKEQYLSEMQEYYVTGFSWLRQSWQPTYRQFTSKGVIDLRPATYRFGSLIRFGREGNYEKYQGYGWSQPENGLTWTNGKSASLIIPVKQPTGDLVLNMSLSPFVASNHKEQRLIIFVNGSRLAQWKLTNTGQYKITVPKKYITNSSLEINFELPDATSPSKLKMSADPRLLGIGMQSITISETT